MVLGAIRKIMVVMVVICGTGLYATEAELGRPPVLSPGGKVSEDGVRERASSASSESAPGTPHDDSIEAMIDFLQNTRASAERKREVKDGALRIIEEGRPDVATYFAFKSSLFLTLAFDAAEDDSSEARCYLLDIVEALVKARCSSMISALNEERTAFLLVQVAYGKSDFVPEALPHIQKIVTRLVLQGAPNVLMSIFSLGSFANSAREEIPLVLRALGFLQELFRYAKRVSLDRPFDCGITALTANDKMCFTQISSLAPRIATLLKGVVFEVSLEDAAFIRDVLDDACQFVSLGEKLQGSLSEGISCCGFLEKVKCSFMRDGK